MTNNEITKYFGDTSVIYQYTGNQKDLIPALVERGISVNYIVVNYTVYLTCSESLDNMLDDKLSVFSTPSGI